VGVVYFGGSHFVSRIITTEGKVYYHDGMDGPYSTFEGVFGIEFAETRLSTCRGKTPSLALYVKD
jgi:hypothetical protein